MTMHRSCSDVQTIIIISLNMGSCFSDPAVISRRVPTNYTNPIKHTVASKSIDKLREKWNRDELQLLEGKVSTLVATALPFDRFLQVFPKLANLSPQTQRKYFSLLAYEGNSQISRKELVNALTIIKKVEESKYLAPLIYFVYTKEPQQPFMSEEELAFFQEENKAYAINLENIDELEDQRDSDDISLQEEHSLPHKQQNKLSSTSPNGVNGTHNHKPSNNIIFSQNNINPSVLASEHGVPANSRKRQISPAEFQRIFSGYNLQHYQILFSWSLPEEERELVAVFLREGVARKKGDKVYLVEYQWFLQWKAYAEQQYQAQIDLREEEIEHNYLSTMNNRRKSQDMRKVEAPRGVRAQKPGEIRNYILKYGRRDNQLVDNLVQFYNFVCVKEEVWSRMVAIYNGGPAIERIYPKFYYNVIVKVIVQPNGRFQPHSIKKFQSNELPTVSGYASATELNFACFYKEPGKKNWKQLEEVSTSSGEVFNCPRTYLTFVPRSAIPTFLTLYNIKEGKGEKLLKERLAHYGTEVNFLVQGVMTRGEVVEVEGPDSVVVEYIDAKGEVKRSGVKRDAMFQRLNPQNLLQQSQLNELSGLDNIGNTCYMNAVIQCLIRTPFFGNYLEDNFLDARSEGPDRLLIDQIASIYQKSKTNRHDSISTKSFKKLFEQHCPYFQGNSQHDAQEFLICLLERLMEEIKGKKEEYGVRGSVEEDGNANKKVVKFFSGKTEAVTTCKHCKNKGVRMESFFTYSLSLPQQPQAQFYYSYVPHHRVAPCVLPILHGITLPRKVTVQGFLKEVNRKRKNKEYKVILYSVFNNEILNRLEYSSYHKEIAYYLHFNAKLACYEVQHQEAPTFKDYERRDLKGKSVKLELRQRIYSQKTQEYKVIYAPYILEVTQEMYWKDLERDIRTIIEKMVVPPTTDPSPNNPSLRVSEIRVSASSIKHTVSLNDSYGAGRAGTSHIRNTLQQSNGSPAHSSKASSFKIHVIKSDHLYENNCFFCKEELVAPKRSSKRLCAGCTFEPSILLLEQAEFRNFCDNIIITVDWEQSIPEFQKALKDESYDYSLQLSQSRKDVLKELLQNNFDLAEDLELRCEKTECGYSLASRTERISIYPNILLLHLKRFTYEDNMLVKLTNSVLYPDTLILPSETYQLYGVVCHIGNGVGGHYVSFVKVAGKWYKCDDHRVILAAQGQQVDPNAYLLFYKRKDFEPALITLSF